MVTDLDLDLLVLDVVPSLFLDWLGSREAAGVVAADEDREAEKKHISNSQEVGVKIS